MDGLERWFTASGGSFHPAVVLDAKGPFGVSVLAPPLQHDTAVVSCPFSLVVTAHAAAQALKTLLGADAHAPLDAWSARQLVCTYLCLHHLAPVQSSTRVLRHLPYVQSLPPAAALLTPLHFTAAEREFLRGTNLYGATLDRERDWQLEWSQCRSLVQRVVPAWADAFVWDMYRTAATHLSSRAFPSSILSRNPSLVSSPSTSPVLIPGVDLLNHKRRQAVSWVISCDDAAQDVDMATSSNTVSIVVHPTSDSDATTEATRRGPIEVFNNYGPKSNDEFILGYGFSLSNNPDDTIALQVGGGSANPQRWVVGRNAQNVQGLWLEVRSMIANGESDYEFEDDLETTAVLSDMVQAKLDGMNTVADLRHTSGIRPAVSTMLEHYIAGQREILESILEFLRERRKAAIDAAREQGIDLVFDDEGNDD